MKISGSAEIELRNLSEIDHESVRRYLNRLEKDENRVLKQSQFLKRNYNKKLFLGSPTNSLSIIYSIENGNVEILEILPKERAKLFLSKYLVKGKSERVKAS